MLKARIAVLVSGGGTNLQALIDAQNSGLLKSGEIVFVVANVKDAYALERAAKAGIEGMTVLRKECGGQEAFEDKLIELFEERDIDLIVLAGFLSILTEKFTGHTQTGSSIFIRL